MLKIVLVMERHLPVDVAVIEIIMVIGKELFDFHFCSLKKNNFKIFNMVSQNYLMKLFF